MVEYKTFKNLMDTFAEQADMYAEADLLIQAGSRLHEYFVHGIFPVIKVLVEEIVPQNVLEAESIDAWDEWSVRGAIRGVFWEYFATTSQIEVETNDPEHRKFVPYREVYSPLVIFEWLMNVRENTKTWSLPKKNLRSGYSIKDYNDNWGDFNF